MDAARNQHGNGSPSSQNPWLVFVQSRLAHIRDIASRDQADRVTDARQAVDEELAAMHLATCSLRTQRNALAPISSLPSEVLARIFRLSSDPDVQKDAPSRLKWIVATHVCRHWRDSALQHPSLWSEPYFYLGSEWARLMLSRAKTVPLSIECLLSNPDTKSDLIISHISHIRHLSLRGTTEDLNSILQSFPSPALIMESLNLSTWVDDLGFILLDKDMLPRLLRIELASISIHWSSPILCGLTHLKLTFHGLSPDITWSDGDEDDNSDKMSLYNEIFHALKRMPALEVLILRNALPFRPEHPSMYHTVMLPHLRILSLGDMTGRCFDIVKQLTFPLSCFLSLESTGYISTQGITDALPVLSNHARNIDGSYPHVLTTKIEEGRRECIIQLRIWRNRASPVSEPENPSLHLRMPLPDDSMTNILYAALSLENLRTLSVNHSYHAMGFPWTPERWIELFGRCRAIEEIHVWHRTVLPFIAALGLPVPRLGQEMAEGSTNQRVFLENLRLLTLMEVDLNSPLRRGTETVCEAIVQGLVVRKQVKMPLPIIRVFYDCFASAKSREELENVAHVEQLSEDVEFEVRQKLRRYL